MKKRLTHVIKKGDRGRDKRLLDENRSRQIGKRLLFNNRGSSNMRKGLPKI